MAVAGETPTKWLVDFGHVKREFDLLETDYGKFWVFPALVVAADPAPVAAADPVRPKKVCTYLIISLPLYFIYIYCMVYDEVYHCARFLRVSFTALGSPPFPTTNIYWAKVSDS